MRRQGALRVFVAVDVGISDDTPFRDLRVFVAVDIGIRDEIPFRDLRVFVAISGIGE
jgi:hypothetical protein